MRKALDSVKGRAHNTFRRAFEVMLNVDDRALSVTKRFGPDGIPDKNFQRMKDVARDKDRRTWEVTDGLARFAIPIAAGSANLFAGPAGSGPIGLLLFVALAGVETVLLGRVLPAIVEAGY